MPSSRSGSGSSKLPSALDHLAPELAAARPDALVAAVDAEIARRAERFLAGLQAYRHHPHRRIGRPRPVLWQQGSTRLLDFGAPDAPVLLLAVPSLINRSEVLHLSPGRSLLDHLAAAGVRPLLVDWDAPQADERGFTLGDYVTRRLEPVLDRVLHAAAGRPVHLLGYCLGGLLAVALAQRRQARLASLTLLATPWDFHAARAPEARLLGALAGPLAEFCAPLGEVPVETLQALFFLADPQLGLRKFSRFAELDPASAEAVHFVTVEDWLNDGVPLALPAARECLGAWYGANAPAQGHWRVAGEVVDPASIALPALVVLPEQDRIVPPASAAALADRLPHARRLTPSLGHVGMVVASRAPREVWQPLVAWLTAPAAA